MNLPYGFKFCESQMTIIEEYPENGGEPIQHKCKFEVCPHCEGRGTHVNRAVDGNGISAQEFADDPEFADAYFSGMYDVMCDTCNGKRVIAVPVDKEVHDLIDEAFYQEALDAARVWRA